MTTPNENPKTKSTANPPPPLATRIGPTDGATPAAGDETEDFQLLRISRTAGGRRIDHAILQVDLGKTGERLVDLQTPTKWSRQVEIRLPAEDDPALTAELLFWGELSAQRLNVGRGESATVTASIDRYHFGAPLKGYPAYDPISQVVETVWRDPVFNPLIDGTIEGNRSSRTDDGDNGATLLRFLHPESARTAAARIFQEAASAELWTLATAVDVVAQVCNPDETFIKNPKTDILADALAPNNVRLKRGRYLPEYLDALLHPFGFDWFVDVTVDADEAAQAEILIFKNGEGVRQGVKFQRPGESLDLDKQNVQDAELTTSISEVANVVRAYGSLVEFEITVPLYRAWPAAGDALGAEELQKTVEGGEPNGTYTDNPLAWRRFEGNEAGDLIGYRDDSPTSPPDFATALDYVVIPARRPLGPTLTLDVEGKRQKPQLEYSIDEGATWSRWNETEKGFGRYHVLNDRIGVHFDGPTPPANLVQAGDAALLRLTGTLTTDDRLSAFSARRESSPNARDVELLFDLSDRFHFRQVADEDNAAEFRSTIADGEQVDERDDTDALDDWLETIQDVHESAGLTGNIALHGLQFDYKIGDLIDSIDGRNISLNRNAAAAAEKKYLQMTGITWDIPRQTTTLHVLAVEKR